jgi:hypothetical protein
MHLERIDIAARVLVRVARFALIEKRSHMFIRLGESLRESPSRRCRLFRALCEVRVGRSSFSIGERLE